MAVAQLGARRHYAVPRVLHAAGMLERFFTDSYSGNKPLLRRLVAGLDRVRPTEAGRRWLSRHAADLPPHKVTSFERLGFAYAYARRRAANEPSMRDVFDDFGRAFNAAVLRYGLGDASVVWGFNSAQLEVFEAAQREGRRCILDQTIAPLTVEYSLLATEHERWPNWQVAPPARSSSELAEREHREWAAADRILCPSEFVRESVANAGGPIDKCVLVPYATDTTRFPLSLKRSPPEGRPLRVLFAGEVGLRKGVPYLLEALARLGPKTVEARLVGGIRIDGRKLAAYADVATFLGSVPRSEMQQHYAWADLFVFPSVCEGSAAVLSEALASGLPVICTPNSGPPWMSRGIQLVPACDVGTLSEMIIAIRDDYNSYVPERNDIYFLTLECYRNRVVNVFQQMKCCIDGLS